MHRAQEASSGDRQRGAPRADASLASSDAASDGAAVATRRPVETTRVLGVPIAHLDERSALDEIERLVIEEPPAHVVHVNAHTLNLAYQSAGYHAALLRANLVLRDGLGVGLAAWLRGRPFPANLNGTDFTPRVLRLAAARRWGVYLLGGQPGVAAEAARRLERAIPGLAITGAMHGYFPANATASVIRAIRDCRTDVLLVAMGNPLQEMWLDRYLKETEAALGIGVGAFLDFVAERVSRAPAWMRRARLEWCFRLAQEPRRLAHRYLVGNPRFVHRVVREHIAAGRALRESRAS
jgi:N-acetylglucosaminyldiphosphoundecaprenol N-acetyl-beta-D-mannosaminyltransferase